MNLTAIIEREANGYSSLCPELDIASQGDTTLEARENLRAALELFFEYASADKRSQRGSAAGCAAPQMESGSARA